MNAPDDVLELEATLRLMEYRRVHGSIVPDLVDFWFDAFWGGVEAVASTRSVADLEAAINLRRALHARVLGETHALHRSGTSTPTPARRKGDPEDVALAAELEAEAQRARDRDRARWTPANEHPGQ